MKNIFEIAGWTVCAAISVFSLAVTSGGFDPKSVTVVFTPNDKVLLSATELSEGYVKLCHQAARPKNRSPKRCA